jgi:hypothetical protein
MMGGMNPWLTMWTQPRSSIRAILQTNPKYGVLCLASIYALQGFFYFANYWSIGFSVPFYAILIAGIILSPFIGWLWVFFGGWILWFTGKWLEGKAPPVKMRAVFAWSKLPTSINLLMWFILLIAHPEYVFILDAVGPTSIFINFITLVLGIWSLVLLIQGIREAQSFSTGRAVINMIIAWVVSTIFVFLIFSLLRYLYLLVA